MRLQVSCYPTFFVATPAARAGETGEAQKQLRMGAEAYPGRKNLDTPRRRTASKKLGMRLVAGREIEQEWGIWKERTRGSKSGRWSGIAKEKRKMMVRGCFWTFGAVTFAHSYRPY